MSSLGKTRIFTVSRRFFEMAVVLGSLAGSGCASQGQAEPSAPTESASSAKESAPAEKKSAALVVPVPTPEETAPFKLKPDWSGTCAKAEKIDINLGHTPESFIRAASCQVTGAEPTPAQLKQWSEKLVHGPNVRRIDVVRTMCLQNSRRCDFIYSDPWEDQPELGEAPEIKTQREIGAVMMFFFNCPAAVNCGMDWANTHAPGMAEKSPALAFDKTPSAYYVPSEPGFWKRELQDAKYAGLSFLMPNVYGPDIEEGKLKPLEKALESLKDPVKIGLMDDTWTWGEKWFSDFWKQRPRMSDTDKTAKILYEAKWKPFFKQIDKKYWYLFKGKPFIYFYNAGKLEPRDKSGAVLTKMKELFKADFGVEPFLAVDSAFFDDRSMGTVADQKFQWFTFQLPNKRGRSTMNGVTMDHAMVKWDAIGRDHPGITAKPGDMLVKDTSVLDKVLADSADADLLILATWNDLGEGTGVNRNYDYYNEGKWLRPDHFIQAIRKSQMTPHKNK
jgi:hypothetical protein